MFIEFEGKIINLNHVVFIEEEIDQLNRSSRLYLIFVSGAKLSFYGKTKKEFEKLLQDHGINICR